MVVRSRLLPILSVAGQQSVDNCAPRGSWISCQIASEEEFSGRFLRTVARASRLLLVQLARATSMRKRRFKSLSRGERSR